MFFYQTFISVGVNDVSACLDAIPTFALKHELVF